MHGNREKGQKTCKCSNQSPLKLKQYMVLIPQKELSKEEWVQQEKDKILKYVTEADIAIGFWPTGRELKFNTAIKSPFRTDECPSFIIGNKYGGITYKDMGDYNFRGDIWKFVQQIEGLQTFRQVIDKIDQRFNLGYSNKKVEGQKIITWEQPKLEIKPPPLIQVSVRKFNKTELTWWNLRSQDISDLKREEIYAPSTIYRNRKKIELMEHTYCYWCPDICKWKLYRPLAPKRVKNTPVWQWKWDNSIGTLTYVENLNKMKGAIGILNKARKDRMVIRKATGIDAICSVQAEDPSALTDETLYQIWTNCETKVVVSDSDKKGKVFSHWLTDEHGYIHCNTPDEYLPEVNDFDGMAVKYGLDSVTKHFRSKGLI